MENGSSARTVGYVFASLALCLPLPMLCWPQIPLTPMSKFPEPPLSEVAPLFQFMIVVGDGYIVPKKLSGFPWSHYSKKTSSNAERSPTE